MAAANGFAGRTIEVGRYTLYYVDEGRGFPILLIHGLAGDHTAWTPQIEGWRSRYRVIATDTRGAGRSTQIDEPITMQDLADDFLMFLDKLGIEKCHIVGRSMGGSIGQLMALKAPAKVHTLTFLSSCAKFEPVSKRYLDNMRDVLEWRQSWADHGRHSVQNFVSRRFFNDNPDKIAAIEQLIASSDRKIACYVHQNHAIQRHDVLDRLGEIKCPVLIMGGSEDPLCGPQAVQWMLDRLPQAERIEIEGAGHFFLMERPEEFRRGIEAFLAKHTPPSQSATG